MQIDGTNASTSLSGTEAPKVETKSGEVGKEAFLRLLIAQLEHQDPMSPIENTEFTAQLAQFNTLEQIQAMNDNLRSLLDAQESMNGFQASNLIGKRIQAQGNSIQVQPGQSTPLPYQLAGDSRSTTIDIYNQNGVLMKRIETPNQAAGDHVLTWDGRDTQGNSVPPGTYTFTVSAVDGAGGQVDADTFIQGIVEGVKFTNNQPQLLLGGKQIDLNSILSVTENTTSQ